MAGPKKECCSVVKMTNNSFFLTYIIPYYQGKLCINTCLDSVFGIGLSDEQLEVLVVDDCSPVAASDVLQPYFLAHPNMRIVRHERNIRQGGAKNTGIGEARGKYVAFADQDDYVLPENVKQAVDYLRKRENENIDILSCRWEIKEKEKEPTELGVTPPICYVADGVRFCEDYVDPKISFGPWSYFYRREYLLSQRHPMAENVLMEDADWIAWHLFHAGKVAFFDKPIYTWNYRTDSTSNSKSWQTKIAWIKMGLRIINDCEWYRYQSELFADKMYENGLYDIEFSFNSLWEIDDYKQFYLTLHNDSLDEKLLELPISQRSKRRLKYFWLDTKWLQLYKPIRMLGHRMKDLVLK